MQAGNLISMLSTPPPALQHIAAIPRYVSGKSAESAMEEHGISNTIKLASNECPFPPLPGVLEAVIDCVRSSNRYGEHPAFELAAAYAARIGRSPANVAVGAGSVALLEQIALAYSTVGDEVVYPWPSFIAYPQFTQLVGATALTPRLRNEALDVDAILAAVSERTKIVLIANPNNPTSTALRTAELHRLVAGIPATALIVIDEAYHEFVTGADVPNALTLFGDQANVAVLRTMSKAHGLAALRVGYMIAHPDVVQAVDACLIPFNVNAAAQAAAFAAFSQDDEVRRRCTAIAAWRDAGAQALRARGFGIPLSQGNFWWLPAGASSLDLGVALERQGVVARPSPVGVRVTVGLPQENDRFLAAFDRAVADDAAIAASWTLATGDNARRGADLLRRPLVDATAELARHADRQADAIAGRTNHEWADLS